MKKFLLSTLVLLLGAAVTYAQVTTSSIAGSVKDSKGEALIGATVKAIHQPTGTTYGASTNVQGRFNIPNVRIGGPYVIEVTYIGFSPRKFTDITLKLGESFDLNAVLAESGAQLQEVVVSAQKGPGIAKTGASTNITSRQIATLPSISRSITDFTRLTPQSNGTNFAGRDNRYNNVQVDGANLNNNFGLSSDPLPGGGAQPISVEAYDEISVNLSPFDVKQSGFTGAGINAVTKSGTNIFHGSAYGYYRNQSFNGTNVGNVDISKSIAKTNTKIYGATIGGPIIKNKLFFFANFEYEKGEKPGITFTPANGSGTGTVSTTPIADLQLVSNYLKTKFGYETGAYDNFPNFEQGNHKFLAKIDWNINAAHKLTLKYSDLYATEDIALNSSSIPNGGGFSVTGASGTVNRLPVNRFSNRSMAFANSNYGFENPVKTATAELNSNFGGRMANQFLATLTKNGSTRIYPGSSFPSIDIFDGTTGNNYISVGMDPYTYNNDVVNDTYSVTNNFTYYAGKHTLTAGGTYEYQKVGNMFMAANRGYYVFNSLNDFLTDQAPRYYANTFSLVSGKNAVFSANLKIGQLGFYAQDEYNPSNNLKLTFGLRMDKPIYHENPLENPQISALQFPDQYGNMVSYSTGKWPSSQWLFSPRVGFRWKLLKDNSLILRGGTGVFTGKIPFVFLTNIPSNSGMYQFNGAITDGRLAGIRLNPDPTVYQNLFPQTAGTSVPANYVVADPNFKFPQVFRTNLAIEKSLGDGFSLNLEALFTKDINAVRMRNLNLKAPTGTFTEGGISRPRYISTASADKYYYPNVTTGIVMENTNKGYSSSLSAQVTKTFSRGFYGSVAYAYSVAKEVTANPAATATSIWNSNPNVGTSNDEELSYSQYATPHRVVANFSYRIDYAKHTATTISLFYQGSKYNDPYSFVVNGDLNGDGNSSADLMYIPKNTDEMNFSQLDIKNSSNVVLYSYTPDQQKAAFEQFINNTPYLKDRRGKMAERNAAFRPWLNRLDMKFLQDFYLQAGKDKRKHTLQFSADFINFANLLNKNWGIQQSQVATNPLRFNSFDATGKPVYNWTEINGKLVTQPFQNVVSTNTTWSIQLGLKYIF